MRQASWKGDESDEATISVGFLLLPGFPLMSYSGAVEPLRAANHLAGRPVYRWWHVSPDDAAVHASSGVVVLPDGRIADERLDAKRVFICAGGNPSTFEDRRVFGWLRRLARRGVALGGISGGPFVLARTGLLDDRTCTLHWEHIPAFQETFPKARVERSLFEIDGDRITCSGGIAALDMSLQLISEDFGRALALEVGDWFLHNQIREGHALQRMTFARRFSIRDERLSRVLTAIDDHLETPLARADLARLANVSSRQLERLFRDALGVTLHDYYLRQRLGQANRLRRETTMKPEEIALATGFDSSRGAAPGRAPLRRGSGMSKATSACRIARSTGPRRL